MRRRVLAGILAVGFAAVCLAGWLNPSQPGYVIQTFTSYQPISGNNTGLILTNGISFQVAGDNAGTITIGGPGSQFRGKNAGNVTVNAEGAFVMGSFGELTTVVNRGKGSLLLGSLTTGQSATITDVGNASILLGAGTVSNNQCIVVGDGMVSHGARSVTAESFWAMGSGFHGSGAGLTDVPTDLSRYAAADGAALSGRVDVVEASVAGNAGNYLASERTIYVATNGNDIADGRTPEKAKLTLAATARERVPALPRLGTGVAEGVVVLPLLEMASHELRASSIPVLGGLTELRALGTGVPVLESLEYQRVASPLWSMVRGPLIRANHAADRLGTIGVFDLPNTNSVPDAVNDVPQLKIISHARGWDATSAKVRAALLAEKGNGYNAVLFEWRVGMNPAPVINQMIWARSRFEKVILAPVVTEAWRVGFFPSVNDATAAMRDLLPHVDAVVLGWGFTIDTVLPDGGPVMETFCAMFFRWCESRAALAGVPTWGFVRH